MNEVVVKRGSTVALNLVNFCFEFLKELVMF